MMEDAVDIGIDAHETPLLNEVTETYLENEEVSALLQKSTTQVENNQSSHSTEDSHSPRVVDEVELPHCPEDYHIPVHLTHDQPNTNGFKLAVDDCSLANQNLVEPGAADVTEIRGDAYIATNNNDGFNGTTDGFNGTTDGATHDFNNHSVCTAPSDQSLEANKIAENGNEVNNVETTALSPTDSGTKEEESTNELTMEESPMASDIKENGMDEGVDRMKLLPENETKGEEEEEVEEEEEEANEQMIGMERLTGNEVKEELLRQELDVEHEVEVKTPNKSFLLEPDDVGCDESGTDKEQLLFMKELETFHKERCLEFKPPKFYGEPLNCLKLWRAVVRLGGYEQVTSCKLWRQVGESFKPPKTCTTVSWTFRCFYEKALLEYEKYKMRIGELPFTDASLSEPAAAGNQASISQASGSGRARRDAAARAMQGWHSQRLLSNGEVGDPIIKDKNLSSLPKREKQLKSIGLLKRKKPSPVERAVKVARMKASKSQLDTMVVDIGPPADWVKINVQRTKDCFEVYALVPGLLREEVRVQSDPAGRLVISGQPEQLDNHWGVTPFKKVVSLPSRIDPHQTSAVVTLHGQLFVRVPFEQSDL